jgi:hypothetical protein
MPLNLEDLKALMKKCEYTEGYQAASEICNLQ